jgi:hypothetical protein
MTNETKQTAVDWQFDQLSSENLLGVFTYDQMTRVMEILEQSNKRFEEQIINAVKYGYKKDNYTPNFKEQQELFEQYYELTYGGNK